MVYIDIKSDNGEMTVSTKRAFTLIYDEPINDNTNVISYQEERTRELMVHHVMCLIKDFSALDPLFPDYIEAMLAEPLFREAPITPPVGSGLTLQDAIDSREDRDVL